MTRLPDVVLDSAVFLFRSVREAEDPNHPTHHLGGSGYLFGIPWEEDKELPLGARRQHVYAVTNRHVLTKSDASVVRLNTHSGGVEAFGFDVSDWDLHPSSDLAVVRVPFSPNKHTTKYIDEHDFLTEERIRKYSFGIGDEVFSPGRFINLTGQARNRAVIRFGAIALMPAAEIAGQELLLVEMRSRSGYSGSPVYVYIDPNAVRWHSSAKRDGFPTFEGPIVGPYFLGTHSGQLKAIGSEIKEGDEAPQTGISTVVPVSKLKELLYMEKLVKEREQYEKDHPIVIIEESVQEEDSSDAKRDAVLKTMLDTPPSPRK